LELRVSGWSHYLRGSIDGPSFERTTFEAALTGVLNFLVSTRLHYQCLKAAGISGPIVVWTQVESYQAQKDGWED
jgi:hypothetical protein